MAYTETDLATVRAAIVSGTRSVTFADRTTVYASTTELLQIEQRIIAYLAASSRPKQTLIVAGKGF